MAFTPTTWVDGTTPITAAELNRIEQGIEDAHAGDVDDQVYSGRVSSSGLSLAGTSTISGWSVTKPSTGNYEVNHGLALTLQRYSVVITPDVVNITDQPVIAVVKQRQANAFLVLMYDINGNAIDCDFSFTMQRYDT